MTRTQTSPAVPVRRDTPVDLHGFADLTGIKVGTLRTYRTDGRLPAPDGRLGVTDWWFTSTVEHWKDNRPGRGARTDLRRSPAR